MFELSFQLSWNFGCQIAAFIYILRRGGQCDELVVLEVNLVAVVFHVINFMLF